MKFLVVFMLFTAQFSFSSPKTNFTSAVNHVMPDDILYLPADMPIYNILGVITNHPANAMQALTQGPSANLGPILLHMRKDLAENKEVFLHINSPGGVLDPVSIQFLNLLDEFKNKHVAVI